MCRPTTSGPIGGSNWRQMGLPGSRVCRNRMHAGWNLDPGDLEWQTPVSALRQSIIDVVVVARICDEDMPLGFKPGRWVQRPSHDAHTWLTDRVPKQIGPAVSTEPA